MPRALPPPAPTPLLPQGTRGCCPQTPAGFALQHGLPGSAPAPVQAPRGSLPHLGCCASAPRTPCRGAQPDPPPALCALGAGAGAVLARPRPRAAAGRWLGARRPPCPWDGGHPSPCSALRARRDGAPRGRLQPHRAMPLGRIKENYSHARRHEPHARPRRQPGHSHSNSAAGPISARPAGQQQGPPACPWGRRQPPARLPAQSWGQGPSTPQATPPRQGAPREASPGRRLCRSPEHPQPALRIPALL